MDSRNLLLIFVAIFFHHSFRFCPIAMAETANSKSPKELATNLCQKTDNNLAFCMQLMKSRPQLSSAKNMKTISQLLLEIAKKQSTITHNFFSRVADSTKKNPVTKAAFMDCARYFNETTTMFSLRGLENGEASLDVHYALDNAVLCETAMAKARVDNALITANIRLWKNYFSVAYSAVVILEDQTPSGR